MNPYDAVVIGAGAAGLMASRVLVRNGLSVAIVEARDRTGGRMFARPLAPLDFPVELGAEFIHGEAPETRALLREMGMAALETADSSFTWNGAALEPQEIDFTEAPEILQPALQLEQDCSVEDFLRRYDGDTAKLPWVEMTRMFVEGFDAADPMRASVKSIAQEWNSGVDSTSARPAHGYAPMVRFLERSLVDAGVRFFFSTVVRGISWEPGNATVSTDAPSGETELRARAVIVTLPVSVLRAQAGGPRFVPALPDEKLRALQFIEMGPVVKVALAFQRAFWETLQGGRYRDAAFFRSGGEGFVGYWTLLPRRLPLAIAWAGGPRAAAICDYGERALVELALHGFARLFGDESIAREAFAGGTLHDWSADPFSRGAYSYVAVGGGDARARLAQPVDKTLFFAGEATSLDGQGGTVNGALETGARAAMEVLRDAR